MKMRVLSISLFLLATCVLSARAEKTELLLDSVVALVNEHVITVGDIAAAIEPMKRRISATVGTAEYKKEVKSLFDGALDALIEKFLILDSDESEKIKIPDWYVDRRVNEIIKDRFAGDRTRFMDILAKDRQSFEQWRDELKDHIVISSIRGMKIENNVSVSPVEVAEFYEKEKGRFVVPGRIRVSMIVLEKGTGESEPEALAEMIKKRIQDGESFSELARKYSTGTYAGKGGDWGWIDPAILREDLRDASDAMKVGEVGIVNAKEDIYIFRVDERKGSEKKDFKDVQPIVERELKRQRADEEVSAWVSLLRKSAYIRINETDFQ